MIFDSHAHYDDEQFGEDRYELLNKIYNSGVTKILNAASCLESSKTCIELSENYSFIYASVGVHPHAADSLDEDGIDLIRKYAANNKVVAIGEIGLDYYYDNSPRDIQKKWFERQLELSVELGLPVIIHDRDAHGDVLEILKRHPKAIGVMHCFSGSREMAEELVKMGYYISFSGSVTFKNARKIVEAASVVPDNRILVETDCPYLAPVPNRGQRNSSLFIPDTIRQLSAIRGMSFDELCDITYNNACTLFKITD